MDTPADDPSLSHCHVHRAITYKLCVYTCVYLTVCQPDDSHSHINTHTSYTHTHTHTRSARRPSFRFNARWWQRRQADRQVGTNPIRKHGAGQHPLSTGASIHRDPNSGKQGRIRSPLKLKYQKYHTHTATSAPWGIYCIESMHKRVVSSPVNECWCAQICIHVPGGSINVLVSVTVCFTRLIDVVCVPKHLRCCIHCVHACPASGYRYDTLMDEEDQISPKLHAVFLTLAVSSERVC